jgi:hypothetical protein
MLTVLIGQRIPTPELCAAEGNAEALFAYGQRILFCDFPNDPLRARVYEKVIALQPEHQQAWMELGIALMDLRRPKRALMALERARDLGANGQEVAYWIGEWHLRFGPPCSCKLVYARCGPTGSFSSI